jgi:hypothetical protein
VIPTFIFTSPAFVILYFSPSSKLPTRGTQSSSPTPFPTGPLSPAPIPFSLSLSPEPTSSPSPLTPSAGRPSNRPLRRQIEQVTSGAAAPPLPPHDGGGSAELVAAALPSCSLLVLPLHCLGSSTARTPPRLHHGEAAPAPRRGRARPSALFSTAPPLSLSRAGSTSPLWRAVELAGPAPSAPPLLATRWRTTSYGAQSPNRAPWRGGRRHSGAGEVRRRTAAVGGGGRAPLLPDTSGGRLVPPCSCGCAGGARPPCGGGRAAARRRVPLRCRRRLHGRRQPPSPDLASSLSSSERRRERGGCVGGTRASPGGGSRIPSDSKEMEGGRENEGGYPVPAAGQKTVSLSSRRGIPTPVRMVLS